MRADEALPALRDIEGVYGSFFVDTQGRVVARDVPSVIEEASLAAAAPRISRLWGVLPTGDRAQDITLEFASHGLFIRRFSQGSLCVLAPTNVNQAALQMAATVAVEQLRVALESGAEEPTPPEAREPQSAPTSGKKRAYIYRGRRFFNL